MSQSHIELKIPKGASIQEIKKAYRELSLIWHPDKFPQNAKVISKEAADYYEKKEKRKLLAEEQESYAKSYGADRYKKINNAYAVLIEPLELKKEPDLPLPVSLKELIPWIEGRATNSYYSNNKCFKLAWKYIQEKGPHVAENIWKLIQLNGYRLRLVPSRRFIRSKRWLRDWESVRVLPPRDDEIKNNQIYLYLDFDRKDTRNVKILFAAKNPTGKIERKEIEYDPIIKQGLDYDTSLGEWKKISVLKYAATQGYSPAKLSLEDFLKDRLWLADSEIWEEVLSDTELVNSICQARDNEMLEDHLDKKIKKINKEIRQYSFERFKVWAIKQIENYFIVTKYDDEKYLEEIKNGMEDPILGKNIWKLLQAEKLEAYDFKRGKKKLFKDIILNPLFFNSELVDLICQSKHSIYKLLDHYPGYNVLQWDPEECDLYICAQLPLDLKNKKYSYIWVTEEQVLYYIGNSGYRRKIELESVELFIENLEKLNPNQSPCIRLKSTQEYDLIWLKGSAYNVSRARRERECNFYICGQLPVDLKNKKNSYIWVTEEQVLYYIEESGDRHHKIKLGCVELFIEDFKKLNPGQSPCIQLNDGQEYGLIWSNAYSGCNTWKWRGKVHYQGCSLYINTQLPVDLKNKKNNYIWVTEKQVLYYIGNNGYKYEIDLRDIELFIEDLKKLNSEQSPYIQLNEEQEYDLILSNNSSWSCFSCHSHYFDYSDSQRAHRDCDLYICVQLSSDLKNKKNNYIWVTEEQVLYYIGNKGYRYKIQLENVGLFIQNLAKLNPSQFPSIRLNQKQEKDFIESNSDYGYYNIRSLTEGEKGLINALYYIDQVDYVTDEGLKKRIFSSPFEENFGYRQYEISPLEKVGVSPFFLNVTREAMWRYKEGNLTLAGLRKQLDYIFREMWTEERMTQFRAIYQHFNTMQELCEEYKNKLYKSQNGPMPRSQKEIDYYLNHPFEEGVDILSLKEEFGMNKKKYQENLKIKIAQLEEVLQSIADILKTHVTQWIEPGGYTLQLMYTTIPTDEQIKLHQLYLYINNGQVTYAAINSETKQIERIVIEDNELPNSQSIKKLLEDELNKPALTKNDKSALFAITSKQGYASVSEQKNIYQEVRTKIYDYRRKPQIAHHVNLIRDILTAIFYGLLTLCTLGAALVSQRIRDGLLLRTDREIRLRKCEDELKIQEQATFLQPNLI